MQIVKYHDDGATIWNVEDYSRMQQDFGCGCVVMISLFLLAIYIYCIIVGELPMPTIQGTYDLIMEFIRA